MSYSIPPGIHLFLSIVLSHSFLSSCILFTGNFFMVMLFALLILSSVSFLDFQTKKLYLDLKFKLLFSRKRVSEDSLHIVKQSKTKGLFKIANPINS